MAETPRMAHLMMLFFLGAGMGTISGLLVLLLGALPKSKLASQMGGALALACAGGYTLILLGTAITTPNKTLPMGSWKYFCEADCHIAYSIASVQTAAMLGTESSPSQAKGEYVVVKLKTWFDEHSISKFRGNSPLTPDPRHVFLVDANKRRFLPEQLKPGILPDTSTPLRRPLRPGESYFTTFVFDVPKEARELRLLIRDDDPVSTLVIDHETSPFHGKIYLSLQPPLQATAQSPR